MESPNHQGKIIELLGAKPRNRKEYLSMVIGLARPDNMSIHPDAKNESFCVFITAEEKHSFYLCEMGDGKIKVEYLPDWRNSITVDADKNHLDFLRGAGKVLDDYEKSQREKTISKKDREIISKYQSAQKIGQSS